VALEKIHGARLVLAAEFKIEFLAGFRVAVR